jgi:hypothetical protein
MTERPVYVGVGECDCKRIDTKLYHVPGTEFARRPVCAVCLVDHGFEVPTPRTADDLEEIDGRPTWKPMPTPPPLNPLVHAGKLDLGYGHIFEAVLGSDEQLIGWLHTHPDARSLEGMLCQSFCAVRPLNGTPIHQVVSVDPLTLMPSLLCRTCGAHGHVTNGKWEPC